MPEKSIESIFSFDFRNQLNNFNDVNCIPDGFFVIGR